MMSFGTAKISPHAVIPITQKGYPKTYAAWGAEGVKRLNALMPLAAQKVARSTECDTVDLVELSDQRSKPPKHAVFFVDCVNGKRFYVDESELGAQTPVQSQTKKMQALSDIQAIATCEKAIRPKLMVPDSHKRHLTDTSVYRAPATGNVVVEYALTASNKAGVALTNRAKCVFTDQGLVEATILEP